MVTLNLRDDCNGRVATNFKRGMTDKRFLELEITAWLTSPERKKQLEGEAYYDGYQDVTHRERLALDEDGKPTDADLMSGCTIAVDRYRDALFQDGGPKDQLLLWPSAVL